MTIGGKVLAGAIINSLLVVTALFAAARLIPGCTLYWSTSLILTLQAMNVLLLTISIYQYKVMKWTLRELLVQAAWVGCILTALTLWIAGNVRG